METIWTQIKNLEVTMRAALRKDLLRLMAAPTFTTCSVLGTSPAEYGAIGRGPWQ